MDGLTNLPRFQDACPNHVQVQGSICFFPKELVSFARLSELYMFEARHLIRSRLIENCISVVRYNNDNCFQSRVH